MIRPVLEAAARIGRAPVRLVSPLPPHDPEPHPGEPFAPVYDFVPLPESFSGMRLLPPVADPYGPDPLVFGPGHQATPGYGDVLMWCAWCDVKWAHAAGSACWICGRPG